MMGTSSPAVIEAAPASKALPASKREHRSPEQKRQIVEETLAAGGSVARVARAHGVNANQVFQWRRLYRAGRLGHPIANATRLLPVTVSEVTASEPVMATAAEAGGGLREPGSAPGTIHIKLPKAQLRIEGHADPAVLRLVLKALLG
jgi:transposase